MYLDLFAERLHGTCSETNAWHCKHHNVMHNLSNIESILLHSPNEMCLSVRKINCYDPSAFLENSAEVSLHTLEQKEKERTSADRWVDCSILCIVFVNANANSAPIGLRGFYAIAACFARKLSCP